jgi:hypothetical protein
MGPGAFRGGKGRVGQNQGYQAAKELNTSGHYSGLG